MLCGVSGWRESTESGVEYNADMCRLPEHGAQKMNIDFEVPIPPLRSIMHAIAARAWVCVGATTLGGMTLSPEAFTHPALPSLAAGLDTQGGAVAT